MAENGENSTKITEEFVEMLQSEQIVISGLSGRFPESSNVEGLAENLFEGIDMITENQAETEILVKELQIQNESPKVWFIFNGMGSQWAGMEKGLMKFDICKNSLEKSAEILKTKNLDLLDILINGREETFDNVLNSFVSIAAIQIALVDLLSSLKIKPDGIIGHSVGELGAAYADNCLTAEQVILTAHARGQAILEMGPGDGAMAAIGLSWEDAMKKCPEGIYPACHNSKDSVTVSGPAKLINEFVDQLEKEGAFARKVNSSNQAFHSKYIEPAKLKFKESLDKIIPVPTPRSNRWISSSIPEFEWESELAKTSSADYHVNNLISPVLFQEALEKVPASSVVIEIGPHCLLQAILKRALPNCDHIGLLNKNHKENSVFLCQSIREMFNFGLNPLISSTISSLNDVDGRCTLSSFLLHSKATRAIEGSTDTSKTAWIESISRILGLNAEELEKNPQTSLRSFGMDSLMEAEIKQVIEVICGGAANQHSGDLSNLSLTKLVEMLPIGYDSAKKILDPSALKIDMSPKKSKKSMSVNCEEDKLQKVCSTVVDTRSSSMQTKEVSLSTIFEKARRFVAYFLSLLMLSVVYLILSPVFSILKSCIQISIWANSKFFNPSQLKIIDGILEQIFVMENMNTVHVHKFSGVPKREEIVNLLQKRLFSCHNDSNLESNAAAAETAGATTTPREGFHGPFERLKWSIKKGFWFCYWKKDEDFDVAHHVVFQDVLTSDLDSEVPRLVKYYQNLKWEDHLKSTSRPWWEFLVLTSQKSQEFLLVLVWNHAYGDGRSWIRMIQQLFMNRTPSVGVGFSGQTQKLENDSDSSRDDSVLDPPVQGFSMLEELNHVVAKTREAVHRAHVLTVFCADILLNTWDTMNSSFFLKSEPHAASAFGKFALSSLKFMKDPETGKSFSLNAVLLTLCSRVYARIVRESKARNGGTCSSQHESILFPAVTWSPFDSDSDTSQSNFGSNSNPSLVNNTVIVPIKVRLAFDPPLLEQDALEYEHEYGYEKKKDVMKNNAMQTLKTTQESLAETGEMEKLLLFRQFCQKISAFPVPLARLLNGRSVRFSFVFSNILAIMPKAKSGHVLDANKLKDMYVCIPPSPLSLIAVTDSLNDSLTMTLTVGDTILNKLSPRFHQLFFPYFEQEMKELQRCCENSS